MIADSPTDLGEPPRGAGDPPGEELRLAGHAAGVPTPQALAWPSARGKGPRQVRAGDTLGRYELGEELGEGGMATVFRARDRELRRDVALKVLFPHLARRPDIVHRFQREARAAAGLEHPNILRIYDVGGAEGDDPPYIVMELIRGRTLLQEIEQRGAMLAEIAACIGALLGDALAAAHAAGVIHRDIKPANVLIAPGGRLLLADFGVARLETDDSLVTRTGALLGTPAYMSPEQASGDVATTSCDVYSLGATLYQLATGALPYSGPPAKVMSMILAGNLVAPVRRRASCGADLSRLIEQTMAADPRVRPAHARVIAAELRAFATTGGMGDATDELAAYFADPDGFLRTRTPMVITALISAARAAAAEAKLPRAMALANRASALAPDDPNVVALVQAVTDGGRASRRNRGLAIGGVAIALAGGVGALGWQLVRAPSATVGLEALSPGDAGLAPDAPAPPAMVAIATDAAADPANPPPSVAAPLDAPAPSSAARDATSGPDSRAPQRRPIASDTTARAPRAPAGTAPPADTAPPMDAAPADAVSVAAAALDAPAGDPPAVERASTGHVIVHNAVWCNIWIDDTPHGNRRNQPLEVVAGHHVVRCVNPAGEWTQEVNVAPGATQTLTGTPLRDVALTLAVDATIDGKPYTRGTVVTLKPHNVEVIVGDKKQFITLRFSCTLRDTPALGCYP